jgi:hypothetical protein
MPNPLPNIDPMNAMPVWLAPSPTGATLTHLTAAGDVLIKTGAGWITGISVNTTGSGSLTVYDGVDATGNVMGVIDLTKQNPSSANASPWPFQTGLFVSQSGAADVTIVSH